VTDPEVATHREPAWRDRADYILQADLTDHGMPGRFEQLWARALGDGRFELCCLPFFTYGYALGDLVQERPGVGPFEGVLGPVVRPSGRAVLRLSVVRQAERHDDVHAALVASDRPHEWSGSTLVAVDIEEAVPPALWASIEQLMASGDVEWEWGRAPDDNMVSGT
jgi:hypothetical protein